MRQINMKFAFVVALAFVAFSASTYAEEFSIDRSVMSEDEIARRIPIFAKNMRKIFRKRVMDVGRDFGDVVDSWDVVNESCGDWMQYRKARTNMALWKAYRYGIMPGDYPLHALLDAKEAMASTANRLSLVSSRATCRRNLPTMRLTSSSTTSGGRMCG